MKRKILIAATLLATLGGRAYPAGPHIRTILDTGLRALYNLEYQEARSIYQGLIEREPANPYGYLFRAGATWWQASNEYGLFKDTPTLEGLFESDIEGLMRTSAVLMDSADNSVKAEGYFLSGMAYGARGQWQLIRGRWMKSYFDGKKAVRHLNRAIKLKEDLYDAYLGLGVYDYQADRLSGLLKLSALLMIGGNAERGIQRLHIAEDRAAIADVQAGIFLVNIYVTEKQPAKALPVIQKLRRRFPDSSYLQFLEITIIAEQGDFPASYKDAKDLFQRTKGDPAIFQRKQLSLWCGLAGEKCLTPDRAKAAAAWFAQAASQAESENDKDGAWVSTLRFYQAAALDLTGQRPEAFAAFQKALAGPLPEGLKDTAKFCLLQPCTQKEIMSRLKAMSLDARP